MSKPILKRTRKTSHMTPADYIRKYSPIKNGLKIKDEDKPLEKYTEILPGLFLGNYQAAKDSKFFKEKKITAVLNCSKDLPNSFCDNSKIEYMRIPIDDSLKKKDIDLCYEFMPAAVEFIYKHHKIQKNNIFIHCYAGRQRSCAQVGGYLIKYYKMLTKDACKYILSKRLEAFHYGLSLNFEDTLLKYEKKIKK